MRYHFFVLQDGSHVRFVYDDITVVLVRTLAKDRRILHGEAIRCADEKSVTPPLFTSCFIISEALLLFRWNSDGERDHGGLSFVGRWDRFTPRPARLSSVLT
jgi:hypothetical protein